MHNGAVKADLPLRALSGEAPEYDRPGSPRRTPSPLGEVPQVDAIDALRALIASPNYCSREWVWEQYDHMVMADTVVGPGHGAAIVRVHGTGKALAFTCDVTPRYVAPTRSRAASRRWPRRSETSSPRARGRSPRPTT